MMLLHNGRGQYRKYPTEYYQVLQQLEELWKQHGDAPDFYHRYYVPSVQQALERHAGR